MSYCFYQTKLILREIKKMVDGTIDNPAAVNNRIRRYVNKVRLFQLYTIRIGHLAFNTEDFLRRHHHRQKELKEKKELLLFYTKPQKSEVSNRQLLTMIKRVHPVIESRLIRECIIILARHDPDLWDIGPHMVLYSKMNDYENFMSTPPQLSLTPEEEQAGRNLLHRMGMEDGARYICLHVRDDVYLNSVDSSFDWSYHDYRDCSIKQFIPAAEYLASRGYYVLRIGYKVKEKLHSRSTRIIDYATRFRSDFGDIFLPATCEFFLGTSAGISLVSTIFNRPLIMTNLIPLVCSSLLPHDLYILKMIRISGEARDMSFKEQLDSQIDQWGGKTNEYQKRGLVPVENTSEDILAVTKEMEARLAGTWVETEQDRDLQSRFRTLPKADMASSQSQSRVGAEFLRKYKHLL